jgi:serine/threonine protein kinase
MSKNRYEVISTIGCGATSRVDKARDTILGRTVALKTIVHAFGAPTEQKQFLREAQIVSQLSHPAIISLYDVGIEQENVAYLVMEYVSGKTLQQVLAESTLPLPRACAWAADLAGALGRAHKAGIIHGDFKPANILISEDGHVKLGDFGIARFATQVSGSGSMMGTPAYLSPEQILGQPQNSRSDLFSLGVVFYQMMTGVPPFDGSSVSAVCAQILSAEPVPPSQRNPGIPEGLDHVVMRCLAKNPADRYPNAEAVAASLYPFSRAGSEPVPVSTESAAGEPTATSDAAEDVAQEKRLFAIPRVAGWFTRPIQSSDVWVAATIAVLLTLSIPVSRAVSKRFRLPQPPVSAVAAPKAPGDLRGYSNDYTIPDIGDDVDSTQRSSKSSKPRSQRLGDAFASARLKRGVVPDLKIPLVSSTPAASVLPLLPSSAMSKTMEGASLQVEIDSTVADGAVAVFADQTLLFTTELHAGTAADPVRFEHNLPSGPHQLRVVLYRADKSLQVAKEGLGQIRGDMVNMLKIHVSRKSKLLVRKETSLDVSWPSAITPTPPGSASSYAAVVK